MLPKKIWRGAGSYLLSTYCNCNKIYQPVSSHLNRRAYNLILCGTIGPIQILLELSFCSVFNYPCLRKLANIHILSSIRYRVNYNHLQNILAIHCNIVLNWVKVAYFLGYLHFAYQSGLLYQHVFLPQAVGIPVSPAFGCSTGNGISCHYFRHFFPQFFS